MVANTAEAKPAAASGTLKLGRDLTVRRLGFGAMRLTGPGIWGEPKDRAEARRVLQRAVDLGIDFIDTADAYGPEVNERLIAEALHPYPAGLVIATKGGLTRQGPDRWAPVGRPEYLRQCVELSLRRLRVERIDLYQLHRFDAQVPFEDTLGALVELQQAGKIRYLGLSEVSVAELERAQRSASIVSVQNRYNLADREHEEVLTHCAEHGLAFIPWSPVAAGALARTGGLLDRAARQHGVGVAQIALAWLLHRSPAILPIPGTSSVAHLDENTAAAALRLTAAEWTAIEAG